MTTNIVQTKPYLDQKTGTSGLRAKTKTYMQENYLENFIQTCFNVRIDEEKTPIKSIVLGGDGRYFCKEAVYITAKMMLANGVEKIYMPKDGLIFTPAHSHMIRLLKADGGFVFSASHNPGGPDGDFGVKIQAGNGGAVLSNITDRINNETAHLKEYKIEDITDEELLNDQRVELIDTVGAYADFMETIFDFPAIKKVIEKGLTARIDCMHASAGPYAVEIFSNRLGLPKDSVINSTPLTDFGGKHPEPNLLYAKELYDFMMNGGADFACAFDGDGDRNMVLGNKFFLSPSDSLAGIARYMHLIPGYFQGCKGIARTMPTSSASDYVAKELGINIYQTPTGWRFFSNLLDANKISICGEESFGTGSGHIREKDGVWAVLAWLNIMAKSEKSIEDLIKDMWNANGRVFYTQYSYEEINKEKANELMDRAYNEDFINQSFGDYTVTKQEVFNYKDPIDGSITEKQGIQFFLKHNDTGAVARIFTRLSGTGTVGATLRMYAEKHETDKSKFEIPHIEYLKDVLQTADLILKIPEYTGKEKADVYN